MDSIPLNAVLAAAADVAADMSGAAVAAPVADIAGAAVDIAADARAALAGAVADTAVVAADTRTAFADAAADVVAAADSAGDVYRHARRVHRHCGLHVPRFARRFWLRSQRPGHGCRRSRSVELFHADKAILQFTQPEICSQSKVSFLGSIRKGETIQDSTANLLFVNLNVVILKVEG